MDSEEAPPPYSAVDPLQSQNNGRNPTAATTTLQLRGGNAPLMDIVSRDGASSVSTESMPDNFVSAAAYFVERPPPAHNAERNILSHHLTIYPRSQAKEFPRRPRCWNPRTEEITQEDWDTFLRYLFPPHLGLASSSGHLPRQLRAQIERDRKDRPQETDEQRKLRIAAVIAEWNQYFFEQRAARIVFVYVTDPGNAPSSSLCPKCYPAATQSNSQLAHTPGSTAVRHSVPPAGLPSPGQASIWQAGNGGYHPGANTLPVSAYPSPFAQPYPPSATFPPVGPAHAYPPHPQYPPNHQPYPWGWYSQPYRYQVPNSESSKSGPFGWLSSLANQAQKYGERITEQAEKYGDQISAQASHYGRQVEEQAMAHGRWIEQQTNFKGKRREDVYAGYTTRPGSQQALPDPRYQAYYSNYYAYPQPYYNMNNTAAIAAPTPSPVTAHTPNTNTTTRAIEPPSPASNQRPRRSSVDSVSSESSLTSIDSISTTSDLSSSDLATVRAQLLSLNDQHDRNLYEAAVGLRRQLDALQDSRRQARVSGRQQWNNGWGQYPQDHNNWGRWESPQQQERSRSEKKAMKEEMRNTKRAFREVVRRARDEQREKRRARRARRRQEQRSRQQREDSTSAPAQDVALEQRLQNLELDKRPENPPTVRSSASFPSTARSVSSSEVSDISSISTPSPTASHANVRDTAGTDEDKSSKVQRKQAEDQQKQADKKRKDDEKHNDKA